MLLWMSVDKVWCGHMSSFIVGIYLGVDLLDGIVTVCLIFWGPVRLFSKSAVPFYIPISKEQGFNFQTFSPTLMIFCLLIYHWQNPVDSCIRSSSALKTFRVPAECQIPRDACLSSTKQNLYPCDSSPQPELAGRTDNACVVMAWLKRETGKAWAQGRTATGILKDVASHFRDLIPGCPRGCFVIPRGNETKQTGSHLLCKFSNWKSSRPQEKYWAKRCEQWGSLSGKAFH